MKSENAQNRRPILGQWNSEENKDEAFEIIRD